jgi:hypothetical protein
LPPKKKVDNSSKNGEKKKNKDSSNDSIVIPATPPTKSKNDSDDEDDENDVSKMYPIISPTRPSILTKKTRNPHLPGRLLWTEAEVDNLKRGVQVFGDSNWSTILRSFSFHEKRDSIALRDKWRNLQGRFKPKSPVVTPVSNTEFIDDSSE